jgi:[acyl-carrier-protein] S-malonyltransferase
MPKLGFVFPGQGSQWVGMGKDLFERFPEAKGIFEAADRALGTKISEVCFSGPEEQLKLTANTQPGILTVSIAAQTVLSSRGVLPDMAAGHSLGEYSALVAAGAISLSDGVRVVRARGELMQQAVPSGVGAMAAVLGLEPSKVKEVCERCADGQVLEPANYNSPEQTVIAGHAEAVKRASEALKEAGAKRVIPLAVSAPFHCSLMEPVKPSLRKILQGIQLRQPSYPIVSNVEARPNLEAARIEALLVNQVSKPVRWVECIEQMRRGGVGRFVEVGPGKVLRGLIRQIAKDAEVFNVEDSESLARTVEALKAA